MDGKISEQRVYCKIRAQLGFPPKEIGYARDRTSHLLFSSPENNFENK